MTYEEFEEAKIFLNKYKIPYECGNYYDNQDMIIGHWIKIHHWHLETDELCEEDLRYNFG